MPLGTSTQTRSTAWCWTLNNYTLEDVKCLEDFNIEENATCSYLIWGKEVCPSTGTLHLQGYIEFQGRLRMSSVKKFFGESILLLNPEVIHLEKRRGSQKQAIEYCKKEGSYNEKGEPKQQGKRSDLNTIRDKIRDGATDLEIADEHFGSWLRYAKGFSKYRELIKPEAMPNYELDSFLWQLDIDWSKSIILWGDPGKGKTEYWTLR